jgi:hypothetical protein
VDCLREAKKWPDFHQTTRISGAPCAGWGDFGFAEVWHGMIMRASVGIAGRWNWLILQRMQELGLTCFEWGQSISEFT